MKLTHFLPFVLALFIMIGCENETNNDNEETAENPGAIANDPEEDVDLDELWDPGKSQDFITESVHTHLRVIQITQAGQNAGFGDQINNFTSQTLQSSQSAYSNLSGIANSMNINIMQNLPQDEIDDMDLGEFGTGEEDDIGEDYLEALIKEYKDLVDHYEDAAEKGTTADLRQHASELLPTLEAHLKGMEELEEEID